MKINNSIILYFIMFLLMVNTANAVTLSFNSPDYIVEGEDVNVDLSIISDYKFNGTIYLTYSNLHSNVVLVNVLDSDFVGTIYDYSWTIKGIAPGQYSIYGSLKNSSGTTLDTKEKLGMVNSSIPRVISTSPSGTIGGDSTTLVVKTNEDATCKYDTNNGTYDNLTNTFSNTGTADHEQEISGLSGGEKIYYVRCRDIYGYTMNEPAVIKFTIDIKPTAQIELSDPSPVKAGTIEVTLITSENLEDPTLAYSFNDAPTSKNQISLTGSGSEWKGYMIISELDNGKVGTFYFDGIDSSGNMGTRITSNNIFVVDTEKPKAPSSIKAETQPDGSIRIKWYYDEEEVDYFNVYRATSSGINYVDFYAESDNMSQQYKDTSTIDKVTYYYKVSAVDKAGNVGSLSNEVFATSISKAPRDISSSTVEEKPVEDVPKVLPPDLVPIVDTFLKQIDKLIIDVRVVSENLEGLDKEKKDLIEEFNIKDDIENTKTRLDNLRKEVENLKLSYATKTELEENIKKFDLETKKIEKITPKDASIIEKIEFIQSTSKADIEIAVSELFEDMGLTEDEKSSYVKLNDKKRDKIKVEVNAEIVSIEYLDGSKEEKTFIRKRLSYEEAETLNDVIVIDIIPKSIAEDVSQIKFNQKYEVLKDDPVVKFGFLEFDYEGETISYSLDKEIDLEEIKNTKSIVLLSLSELTQESSKITGLSIFSFSSWGLSETQSLFAWLGIIVIMLLGAYYLLFVRDYKDIFVNFFNKLGIKNNRHFSNRFGTRFTRNDSHQPLKEDTLTSLNKLPAYQDRNRVFATRPPMTLSNEQQSAAYNYNEIQGNIMLIESLINKANYQIEKNMHNEAAKIYPQISFYYQNLPKELKPGFYNKCAELHRRINNRY